MKISRNWLSDYITTDLKTEKIGEYLTDIGLEVEGIQTFENIKGSLQGIVVGKVLTCEKHPNADKLNITTVELGTGEAVQIVCGAPNVAAGQTVPVATVGAVMYTKDGGSFEIKKAKIRGEVSQGMICSQAELGIGEDQSGILVLDEEKFQVGTPLADYFDISADSVYEIGLTPNRTDAMSHYGVARDLNAYLHTHMQPAEFKKISVKQPALEEEGAGFSIEIEDAEQCPKYLGAVIEGVQVAPSPAWLQDRLKAIGLSPINNIVDITNYILHSVGQPLHAFDADKIKGKKIKVGYCAAGTVFTTLDGTERKLGGEELIIKDGENTAMCIAGVFGGADSGVQTETTNIFLESAYFNPVRVRRGAKQHGLNTDASFRFERGVDPAMVYPALQMAVELIIEIAGGSLKGAIFGKQPGEIKDHYIVLRFSKIDQILGAKIHHQKIKEILKALDIEVLNEIQNGLEISVPAYRADVTREIDVIEEILRIYGYNKIDFPEKLAFAPVKIDLDDQDALENKWARSLQSNGFYEVMNNSLTSLKQPENAVKLLNPLSSDLQYMRTSLLEGLLENADYNIKRKNADLKFFEFGKIYHKKETYTERRQLAILTTGRNEKESWQAQQGSTDFYRLKGAVEMLLQVLPVTTVEEGLEDSRFAEAIAIKANGKIIARLGKVAAALLKDADIDQPCYYAEIELEICQQLRAGKQLKFKDIPKFNTTRKDLALLVDASVQYADLFAAARTHPSPFLKAINLFDVYEGKNLPEGKKSYAMSFELLNEEKTLSDQEISQVMNSLVKTFKEKFGAELRS